MAKSKNIKISAENYEALNARKNELFVKLGVSPTRGIKGITDKLIELAMTELDKDVTERLQKNHNKTETIINKLLDCEPFEVSDVVSNYHGKTADTSKESNLVSYLNFQLEKYGAVFINKSLFAKEKSKNGFGFARSKAQKIWNENEATFIEHNKKYFPERF